MSCYVQPIATGTSRYVGVPSIAIIEKLSLGTAILPEFLTCESFRSLEKGEGNPA